MLYVTEDMYCMRNVQVGTDVRARIKGQFLHLLTDADKDCMTPVEGTYELSSK